MKFKKILCVFLFVAILLSIFCIPQPILAKEKKIDKISIPLSKMIQSMDEKEIVPVYLLLKNNYEDELLNSIKCNYGFDPSIFDNPDLFWPLAIEKININGKPLNIILSENNASYSDLSFNNINSPLSLEYRKRINSEITKTANYYLKCYRQERKKYNNNLLSCFIDRNQKYINSIITKPLFANFLIVNVCKEDLYELAKDSLLDEIDYFENEIQETCSWNLNQVTESDSVNGIGSIYYNDGLGYDGTDINIGVIEAVQGRCDVNDYNLTDANITLVDNPDFNTFNISGHATHVTTLICGKKTIIDGKTYEGAAKGASIYQMPVIMSTDVIDGIDELVNNYDVNIINYSGGHDSGITYSGYDKAMDALIDCDKVSVVLAAGNQGGSTGNILSPAKAFNAITVGNLKTKTTYTDNDIFGNNNQSLSPPYYIKSSSSTYEADYLPNKPDVVAPGSYVYLPTSASEVHHVGSGTSYSAPVVTGIAAQIMQENYSTIFNTNALKSYLMCGASNDQINGTSISYGCLTDESGAGLVNAKNTLAIANSGNEVYGLYTPYAVAPTPYYDKATVRLSQGDRIRIVVSFRKAENIDITSDYGNNIDLRLIDTNSSYSVLSESTNNNVEVIDVEVPNDSTYSIQMKLTDSLLAFGSYSSLRFWLCWKVN